MIYNPVDNRLNILMTRAKQLYKSVGKVVRIIPFYYSKQHYTAVRYGAFLHVYDGLNRKCGVRRI